MRSLSTTEIKEVSGGNFAGGVLQLAGAYYTGFYFGEGINVFNQEVSGMSLGEALFYTFN
jgi:hypothetical protein